MRKCYAVQILVRLIALFLHHVLGVITIVSFCLQKFMVIASVNLELYHF
jgi:hypothetical protein